MKHLFFFIFCYFPLLLFSQEHHVQTNSENNKFVLNVKNSLPTPLQDVKVTLFQKPDWMSFSNNNYTIASIPPDSYADAEFSFSVGNVYDNTNDLVVFLVSERNNNIGKFIPVMFRAFSDSNFGTAGLNIIYPNPTNMASKLQYTLSSPSSVTISIYNLLGQKVRTLLKAEQPSGKWEITWDGQDDNGLNVSTGSYMVNMILKEHATGQIKHFNSKLLILK